jgi:cyclic-di-GMP phosphodiesterase TipF (flagellum assembly factor)
VLKHLLIAVAYILLAVALALVLPGMVPGLSAIAGWVIGAVALVAGALAHEAWTRMEAGEIATARLFQLHTQSTSLRKDVDYLQGEVTRLDAAVGSLADGGDSKAKADLDRVVSEVRVLQNLIGQLSTGGGEKPATNKPQDADAPPKISEDLEEEEILNIVREGLKRDRVDLYLQPVVSLPQRKIRFYECFSRIRSDDGRIVLPQQYIDVASREGLIGAIDNLLLFRCVQLVRRAQSQKHSVGFFCNISANTLCDRAFFSDFVDFMGANTELARNLIFEFRQEDVDAHSAEIDDYIARLGSYGFYFSLDRVGDLSKLDIPGLSRKRFKYIKIDGAQLLPHDGPGADESGQAAEGGDAATIVGVNVAALKRVLDVHGIDLIAEKIETEQDLLELLDYRIDYGQGYLFGEPRISKEA